MTNAKKFDHEKTIGRKLDVTPYAGTNDKINEYLEPDDTLWIVQGSKGRVPMLANSEDEAKQAYIRKFAKEFDEEDEEESRE